MIESLDLPALPEGWVWTEVGDIGNIVTGTTPSKSKKEYYGNDFPFFKPTDLNNGYFKSSIASPTTLPKLLCFNSFFPSHK